MQPCAAPSVGRGVPAGIEAAWLARARAVTGTRDDARALERLVQAVQALSDRFTSHRPEAVGPEGFARYGDDPTARAAYDLWFGAQAWVRTRLPLALARSAHGWAPAPRAARVLDVGAASGAAGLSAATWLREVGGASAVELVALDHARGPLDELRRVVQAALPAEVAPRVRTALADVRALDGLPPEAAGPFDLIVVSFTLNELWPAQEVAPARAWLAGLAARLAPDGMLLVLEPAMKPQALRLCALCADLVDEAGLHAWGPQQGPGAWRPAPDPRTWPHEARGWRMPASVAHLNRTLWRSAAELTFAYALLGRRAPPAPPDLRLRLASPPKRWRGRRTWLAYDPGGALVTLELQDRDATRAQREALEASERGDLWCLAAPPRPVGDVLRLARALDVAQVIAPEGARTLPPAP